VGIGRLVEGGLEYSAARFEMPRPEGAAEIEEVLGCAVEFGAGVHEFVMPRKLLERPFPGADPDLFRYCEGLLEQQRFESMDATSYTTLARTAIEGQNLGEVDGLTLLVPSRIGCSSRTLQRRLSEEGTSMRELVVDARRARSLELLRSDMTLGEVAHTLGYAEPASFRRAFRRWHNHSPAAWRKHFG
jgi:AraC-like DNA-binding protein